LKQDKIGNRWKIIEWRKNREERADRIRRLNPDFEMAAFESLDSELHDWLTDWVLGGNATESIGIELSMVLKMECLEKEENKP
jgi:hypothetical protein